MTRRSIHRRTSLRGMLIVTVCFTLAGCGDSRPNAAPPALDPQEVLRSSIAASRTLTTFRLDVDATLQARFRPGTVSTLVSDAVAKPLIVTGQGRVVDDAAAIDVDATISGLPGVAANVTKVGEGIYIDLLGTTYQIGSPRSFTSANLPHALLRWVTTPTEAGRDTVDGVATVHLTGTIDAARAVDDLASFVPSLVPTAALRRAVQRGIAAASIDVWIGLDDERPYRMAATLRYDEVPAFPSLTTATLTFDLRLRYEEDAPARISAPDTWEPLPIDRLGALAGGG